MEIRRRATALLLLLVVVAAAAAAPAPERKTYIVHVAPSSHKDMYSASLSAVSPDAEILYSYGGAAVHGFAARLTDEEAAAMAEREEVLVVNPDVRYELHTTRTPEFLGLVGAADESYPQSDADGDCIVGVLDTGVWPELKSFDDAGFAPVPSSWHGECEQGKDFNASNCNRKLVGARFFLKGYEANKGPVDETKESRSPRDNDGHGTHTSTTAAGGVVAGASLLGYAAGVARGMAPRARVAVYKVCWLGGCFSSDILAAIEAAVADGVSVLSLSLGGGSPDYYRDSIAIGAFGAMEKGVFVSCSGGNAGPGASTLSNLAPWLTTVGAGTIDRDFPAYVSLGNGKNYTGVSLYAGRALPADTQLPFIYAGNASNAPMGSLCMPGTLNPDKVAGKIVLCDRGTNARVQKGYVVKEAGGAGMVLANTAANGEELVADAHLLPAAGVGQKAGDEIRAYAASDPKATASVSFGGTHLQVHPSPVVSAFSSRGPNSVTPEILKPDMIAPGVNVLAGWSGSVGPTGLAVDDRRVQFNIISGTSMSCPHVSGLAALLKGAHPEWSPAAIRSALMTTAYATYSGGAGTGGILDVSTGKEATPFDIGAGHVDPPRAVDPGLVYDIAADEYLHFMCAIGYTQLQIAAVAHRPNFTCDGGKNYSVSDLNYPSFAVVFSADNNGNVKHTRTMTNVGGAGAKYNATVTMSGAPVVVRVQPESLAFSKPGEKQSYTVSFTAQRLPAGTTAFGRLVWSDDGKHTVASPIAVSWT